MIGVFYIETERGSNVSRENSLTEPSSSSSTTDEIKWYPQKKLEIAKRKLEGDNPVGMYNPIVTQLLLM